MATPAPLGSAFPVNTTTAELQGAVKTARFADGSFIAVWIDYSPTAASSESTLVRGQLFNADGSRKGGELLINDAAVEGFRRHPTVEVLSDGRFVVAWAENNEGETGENVRARIFNADASPYDRVGDGTGTGSFQVNTATVAGRQGEPSIIAMENGGFIVSFSNFVVSSNPDIQVQAFDGRGNAWGDERFVASSVSPEGSGLSAVTLSLGGRYAVFTNDAATADRKHGISGSIFMSEGTKSVERFEVTLSSDADAFLTGAAVLADGRILVTWVSVGTADEGVEYTSKAQILSAGGAKVGGEIVLDRTNDTLELPSHVAALPEGGFAMVYQNVKWAEGAELEIENRVSTFDANGVATGTDIVLSQGSEPLSFLPHITVLADGRLFAAWSSRGASGDEEDTDVFGQIIDTRSKAVTLSGTAGNDEYYGTAFDDNLGGAAGNDKLTGAAGGDRLNGGAGADILSGGDGSDVLDGGTDADILRGGTGADIYYVDQAGDQVIEEGGDTDLVLTSISYALGDGVENLAASGMAALALTGNGLDNLLGGNGGKNTLSGGLGQDTLSGSYGNDVLRGGKGKDVFVFNGQLGSSKSDRKVNFDTIKDFKVKDDSFWLDNAVFRKLGKKGSEDKPAKLAKKFFSLDKAKDKNDYIVYDRKKGILSYDPDGSGSKKAIEIAKLSKKLKMTHKDFFVI